MEEVGKAGLRALGAERLLREGAITVGGVWSVVDVEADEDVAVRLLSIRPNCRVFIDFGSAS